MTSENFIVPPLSWDRIGAIAMDFRKTLGIDHQIYVPVIDLVEKVLCNQLELFELEIRTYDEMDGAEGLTCPSGKFIHLRQDVYDKACDEDPRARFTVIHEIGHWYLHANSVTLKRSVIGDGVPLYRKSEPQANQFAGEFLMPRQFMYPGITQFEIMQRHGVSAQAASIRLDFLRRSKII